MRVLRSQGDPTKVSTPQWYVDLADRIQTSNYVPTPTREDSLFLLNNNREIDKLISQGYLKHSQPLGSSQSWNKDYVDLVDHMISAREVEKMNDAIAGSPDDYFDFSRGPMVGSSDWAYEGGDDLGMPMHYIHPAIKPQWSADYVPHNQLSQPYVESFGYEDIMITPWDMLTADQKNERIQMAIDSNNLGGIPQSVVDNINSGMTPVFKVATAVGGQGSQATAPQPITPQPSRMTPMSSIQAGQVDNSLPQRSPVRPATLSGGGLRPPQPTMQADQRSRVGQYQTGEYRWDPDKKKWQMDPWDRQDQDASKRQWRIIKAPKF
jgi:hypothetical protein